MKHIHPSRVFELPLVSTLQGYHITDDPQIVTMVLLQGLPIDRGQDISFHDDLKASGLYFSEAPQLWVGRSVKKWEFAKTLIPQQRIQIVEAVAKDDRFIGDWYLTPREKERAAQYLKLFAEAGDSQGLLLLAEQPFNLQTWKRNFLSPLGIGNDHVPFHVPVEVKGKFANVSDVSLSSEEVVLLKRTGYDGMFVLPSLLALPQAVVWNNRAIVQFGKYRSSTTPSQFLLDPTS